MRQQLPRYVWILIIAFSLISTGVLGFKTAAECISEQDVEKATCYHQAAISSALVNQKDEAIENCELVRHTDIDTANAQANACFGDIAVLIKDERGLLDKSICSNIEEDQAAVIFTGADVTRNSCIAKIEKINNARNYQCPLFYIFPLALVLAICFRSQYP